MPRTLLPATVVVLFAPIWFPAVALLVDRLGRWLRRPCADRAVEGGSGAALTVLGRRGSPAPCCTDRWR